MGKSTAALLTDFLAEAPAEKLSDVLAGRVYLDPEDDNIYLKLRDFLMFAEKVTGEVWGIERGATRLTAVSGQPVFRSIDGRGVNLYRVRKETLAEILALELSETVNRSEDAEATEARALSEARQTTRDFIAEFLGTVSREHSDAGVRSLCIVGFTESGEAINAHAFTGALDGLTLLGLLDVQRDKIRASVQDQMHEARESSPDQEASA